MTGYRDASPWDVLTKPAPPSADVLRTARGYPTVKSVLLALRGLGKATPTQIGDALGVPSAQAGRLLYALWHQKEVNRVPVRVQGKKNGWRSSYEYTVAAKKETLQ